MLAGPIIIVEDDEEDQEVMEEMLRLLEVGNSIIFFENGQPALDYLYTTKDNPFLIICDINMPVMNGLQLRNAINNDPFLVEKSIPFVFYTTHADKEAIRKAYLMSVQGFFEKPQTISEIKKVLKMIIDYWTVCNKPSPH